MPKDIPTWKLRVIPEATGTGFQEERRRRVQKDRGDEILGQHKV